MTPNPYPIAVLMCHAPIVIPGFAGSRGELCVQTTRAMEKAASLIAQKNIDVVVVLSPHTPRYRSAYGVVEGSQIEGDFGGFGRADLQATFSSDKHIQQNIERIALELGANLKPVPSDTLDHGALVPLYFLKKAGYEGSVIVLGFPAETTFDTNRLVGEALRKAAIESGKKWALLASGDMSHRLSPGAPAGFHPHAERFDRLVVKCVESGEFGGVSSLDPDLRELAAEDVVDSIEIACAAIGGDSNGRKLISYEAPFGVGYLVAILRDTE